MNRLERLPLCALLLLVLAAPTRAAELGGDVQRLVEAARSSNVAYETLAELCDRFGHRLSGTPALEASIDWLAERARAMGLANVRKEPVMVPKWVRGEESLRLLAPGNYELAMLGLGGSVGTGPEGIEADLVRVTSFEELDALTDDAIEGRIVLYDVPFEGYGKTVRYRGSGASRAAARGAVAALVRSVGLPGMRTPHTGALRYDDAAPKIPAAAIANEDADILARILARGDRARVRLSMRANTEDDARSHNLLAEVVGREVPEEIVVVGGHIDSWDVGQGAQDDGVGCVLALEAARLLVDLDLRPRRTVRVVLWTNEENGLRGGRAYAEQHRDELDRHVAAIESDSGNGLADGFRFDLRAAALGGEPTESELERARQDGLEELRAIAELLEPLGADRFFVSYSGADIGPLAAAGVPSFGMNHDTTEYFRIHHTPADTFDRIDLEDLRANAAALAALVYALAERPGRIGPDRP